MENIAHTFFGAALAQTGLKKLTGLGMATLLISANLPDIDLLWSFYSKTSYLVHHRGITHSFAGIVPQMFILAGIMYFLGKWLKKRNPETKDVNFSMLLLLSFLGLLSHLGLDFLNDYGVRPFLPFSEKVFYGSTIFIVDTWFWLLLGGYTFLSINLGRRLVTLFSIFALASSLLILLFPGLPLLSRIIYITGVILLTAFRLKLGKISSPRLSFSAFSLFFIYIMLVTLLRNNAEINFSQLQPQIIKDRIEKQLISPEPLDPFNWNFLAANGKVIYKGMVQSLNQEGQVNQTIPTNFSDPFVQKALQTETGKAMQYFSLFLFADIKKEGKWIYVSLRDARYIRAGKNGFAAKEIKFPLSD